MDYKIGDKVVYPNHGVGVVEQMSYGVLNGRTERYYMIRIVSSGLRVMVPHSNALAVGLRSVIRSNDTTKVLGFLEKGKLNSHHDWKHRFKENSERMRTGSLLEVAVVLKSLVSLSRSKPLSFREKKMLERAKYLLVSEMATARNLTAENAEGLVVKSLAKAKLQFPHDAGSRRTVVFIHRIYQRALPPKSPFFFWSVAARRRFSLQRSKK